MSQQTALQELIKELKNFSTFPMVDKPTIEAAIEFAELRLEKERAIIIDAVNAGSEITNYDTGMTHEYKWVDGLQYFNATFTNQ